MLGVSRSACKNMRARSPGERGRISVLVKDEEYIEWDVGDGRKIHIGNLASSMH